MTAKTLILAMLLAIALSPATAQVNSPNGNFNASQAPYRLTLQTAGLDRLRILPTGEVGIGTNSPAEMLHINGNIRGNQFGGALRINTGSGYIDIGPQNQWWGHIYTDRDAFLFNKPVYLYTGVLSTYTTADLSLQTNGSSRLTILNSSGNVGIGTVSPAEKLHINGSIRGNAQGSGMIRVSTGHGYVDVGPRNESWSHFETDRDKFYFNKPLYVNGSIDSYNTNHLVLRTADTERLTILNGSGNVGIGTSSPAYKLDVNGSINASSLYLNGSPFTVDLQWTTSGADVYYDEGNVGIGTSLSSNPNDYKLAVNGNIGAHQVRVEQTSATWPDYVFDEGYELPSLAEVEAFIIRNKRLKDIPSAEEVKETGHDLGSMDAALLKKIEELTLYVLQQERRLKAQEEEITNIREELELGKSSKVVGQ